MQPFDVILRRVLDDVVNNKKPSEIDLSELRFIALGLDRIRNVVGGWIGPDGQPNVNSIRAGSGVFDVVPLDFHLIYKQTAQSIPNNTETAILLSTFISTSRTFAINSSDQSKVDVAYTGRLIGIIGRIQWAANATGRRAIHLNAYDNDDVLLYGATLHSRLPTNIGPDTIPLVSVFPLMNYSSTGYLKITCLQTSGGALDMQYFEGGLFLFR